MALPATHLRFAAALADRLAVSDWPAYLSGTIYPDSRWVTGIGRHQTHAERHLDPAWVTDDFTRGWHIHCICDRIQGDIHTELLGDLSSLPEETRWVRRSAAKVIQDMQDAANSPLRTFLPLLGALQTPNQESGEDVDAYLGYIKTAYRRPGAPDWQDYARLWREVGLDRTTVDQLEKALRRMRQDGELTERLETALDQMMTRFLMHKG